MHICWLGGQGSKSNIILKKIMNRFNVTKTWPFNTKAMDHMTRLNDAYLVKLVNKLDKGNYVFNGKNDEN